MPRKIAFLLALLALGARAGCATIATAAVNLQDTSRTFSTVVVDAGHGGKDSGASRRFGPVEKVITLDVAQRLNRKLRQSQIATVMTRSSDVFIPLDERVAIGNRQRNSIFVSIHFNDSRRGGTQGIETYYGSPYARGLAQRIQSKLLTLAGARGGGVRTARFRVIRNAIYPSVLVECGYLSNRTEGRESGRGEYREMLADKIAQAIVEERSGRAAYGAPTRAASANNLARGGSTSGAPAH